MDINIIKKLTGEIKMPRRGTENSAGYDVFASYSATLKRSTDTYFTLPVAVEFDPNIHKACLFLRSSIGINEHIRLVVDKEVVPYIELEPNVENIEKAVVLRNEGFGDFQLEEGHHFAQIIIMDREEVVRPFLLEEVRDLKGVLPVAMSTLQKENGVQTFVLEEPIVIEEGMSFMFASGYKAKIDEDTFLGGFVPQNEKRFVYSNGTAIIDSDYYGNAKNEGLMFFKIDNVADQQITLEVGTELVDLISKPFYKIKDEIVPTEVRKGGIGSTTEKKQTAS